MNFRQGQFPEVAVERHDDLTEREECDGHSGVPLGWCAVAVGQANVWLVRLSTGRLADGVPFWKDKCSVECEVGRFQPGGP